MEDKENTLEEINAEIEKELLQKLEGDEEPEEAEVTVSRIKLTIDIIIIIIMILFIITNIGVIIWKLI